MCACDRAGRKLGSMQAAALACFFFLRKNKKNVLIFPFERRGLFLTLADKHMEFNLTTSIVCCLLWNVAVHVL